MATTDVQQLREDYQRAALSLPDTDPDPIVQFRRWFEEAVASEVPEPNAMTVATASPDGVPSARVVLLKDYDAAGFVFYTNYESQKGRELDANPRAAAVFVWLDLERQVRIEGAVERISAEQSTAYYHRRPKKSQIGAWASDQSRVIEDRAVLEEREAALNAQYADAEQLPRPAHWGGYRIRPRRIEFWQGRSSRLHDRINYRREAGAWVRERLAP